MKHLKLFICMMLLFAGLSASAQNKKPDWVENRPPSMLDYIGIASASKSNPDYREIAKRAAMAELVSQIEVSVSVNSLVNVTEKDDSDMSSYFTETVKTSATKRLQNLQLYETWEDEDNYWAFYRLDKEEYAEQLKKMIAQATKQGSEYWQSGAQALQSGDLMTALEAFMNGLAVIEPYANEDLKYESDGTTYSLGNMLYTSFRTIFDGIELKSFPTEIEIESFKGKAMTVSLMLTRENQPLRNMNIRGEFINGSGMISPIPATDASGKTSFDIQNVTSKNPNQSLRLELDTRNFMKKNDATYTSMLKYLNKNLPACVINLNTAENSTLSAFIDSDINNNASLVRSLKTFINNKYFDITDTPNTADVIIKVNAKYQKGGVVKGDVYNMNEYFTTINISFIDNRTGREISNYSLESKRTLVPTKASASAAKNTAVRDAMKSVKRQLPDYLKNIKINTDGAIPQRDYPKEKEPVVVVKEVPVVVIKEVPVKEESKPAPQPKPVPTPQPKPAPQPEPKPQPVENNYIEAELEEGIFIRYVGKKDLTGKTILKFQVINTRNDDYKFLVYNNNIKVIDNNGSEAKVTNMRIGSQVHEYSVSQLVVPEVPTRLEIEVPTVEAVALFSVSVFTNGSYKVAKLRKLNY